MDAAGAPGPSGPSGAAAPVPRAPPATRSPTWLDRLFPAETDEPYRRTGFASDSRFERRYLLLAVGIALGFAALWEWIVRVQPVPPGGDPSTWIITSYPFVGLPTTQGVQPLGYPPASFPFVGLSVIAGGGPLDGGRIYMGAAIAFLGLAAYLFGRTLLERPSLALVVEGLWLGEPDFQQLYYFGGYPNIFALIFLTLTLAFFVRFLRSRRPSHLFLFWVFFAVTILAHSLSGVILAGILVLAGLALLLLHRFPRTVFASRAGLLGILVLAASVGGYYLGTAAAGIGHPSYLESTPVTTTKAQLLPRVLRPFYLTAPVQWVTGTPTTLSSNVALAIVLAASVAAFGLFLVLLWQRPGWLTTSWIVLTGTILTVFGVGLVAYYFAIPIDYRRLPYFLYGPAIFLPALPIDQWLTTRMSRPDPEGTVPAADASDDAPEAEGGEATGGDAEPAPAAPSRLARRRSDWRRRVDPLLVAAGLLVLTGVSAAVTVPSGAAYESFYTEYAHDQDFLNAVTYILNSPTSGNIITNTPYVAHWPSTITNTRITYTPSLPNGNGYAASHVQDGELASVALAGRYTTTNSLVGASISGVAPNDFTASPLVGAFASTAYQPLLEVAPGYLTVGVATTSSTTGLPLVVALSPAGVGAPPVNAVPNCPGLCLLYTATRGIVVWENVTTLLGSPTVSIAFTAVSPAASPGLTYFTGRVSPAPLVGANVSLAGAPGSFLWTANTRNGLIATTGSVSPAGALARVVAYGPNATPAAIFRENATDPVNGSHRLTVSLTLSIPSATNVLAALGSWIDSAAVWGGWDARFYLQYTAAIGGKVYPSSYLTAEYGASLVASSGPWQVYLLPPL
ncbi:MAG TPA: hypothetical protein VMH78_08900 [Thermoplasmata archaeon]|nr:hypothetical protein [Thermoplasmata archaeon]